VPNFWWDINHKGGSRDGFPCNVKQWDWGQLLLRGGGIAFGFAGSKREGDRGWGISRTCRHGRGVTVARGNQIGGTGIGMKLLAEGLKLSTGIKGYHSFGGRRLGRCGKWDRSRGPPEIGCWIKANPLR
jgi:hypothetical protein